MQWKLTEEQLPEREGDYLCYYPDYANCFPIRIRRMTIWRNMGPEKNENWKMWVADDHRHVSSPKYWMEIPAIPLKKVEIISCKPIVNSIPSETESVYETNNFDEGEPR